MTNSKPGRLALLAIGSLFLLPACSDDVSAPSEPTIPTMTLAQLRSAPEMLDLAQQDYSLEAYLWRDFMPIAPSDGRPLVAVARLASLDQEPIPGDVELVYLWVVNGNRVWSTTFSDGVETPDNVIQRYAYNGPKWGPGISVDVVVGVKIDSTLRLVRAPAQPIYRTD
jgi:hypothetical protein